MHRYEGSLNKIPHAVVRLSYLENSFGQSGALRVFLCSDSSLEDKTILLYYSNRWRIEDMFRSHKRYMGFKSFMVRTVRVFDYLLIILCLAHFSLPAVWVPFSPFTLAFASPEPFSAFSDFAHL